MEENKVELTDAQREVQAAMQKERDECWKEVQDILQKYQYRFTVAVNISDKMGIGFIIDILKLQPQDKGPMGAVK